jgi:hypothetical protein
MSAAEVSIGVRLVDETCVGVRDALTGEHSLIKTFGPRGTVHLLPAADLALWCGALGGVPPVGQQAVGVRLTAEQTDELVDALGVILGGAELTVDEITEALGDAVGAWAVEPVMPAFQTMWPRWRQMVSVAAFRGVLCFGVPRGRKVTYTNPARWLPGFAPVPHDEAIGWLLERYLHAYGPAAPPHFARWLSTRPGWAASLFDSAELTEVTLEGGRAWVAAGDTEFGEPARGVHLLPHFDAFAVGSYPRELLFPGRAWERALAGSQAGNFPVLLVDGVVAGVWHQKKSARTVAITVEPLADLTAGQLRQLDDQVQRVGAILDARPTLTIGPINVGAHA